MVTQGQATQHISLLGISLLYLWAVLFVIAMVRIDRASGKLMGSCDRTGPATLVSTLSDERHGRG